MASTPDPTPSARAWLEYERPVATVRSLFFDVDLAIRSKIHRGIRLQWALRTASGERRIKQQTRVFDRMQIEQVVIEEDPRGAWVKRFVEGPNTGTRFVGRFDAAGEGTRVQIEAFVGPSGFAQGLGKLSPLGLEKSLKRVLSEYKLALQGYEAGRARGEVLAVLIQAGRGASMAHVEEDKRRALMATLLEAAWVIAAVDAEPDKAERDAMQAIVGALWHTAIDRASEERMVRAAVDAVKREGAEARCAALGARLKALGVSELGVALAVLVAEVSRGLDPVELSGLQKMAAAAGIGDARLMEIIRETDEALSGGDRLSRMSTFL